MTKETEEIYQSARMIEFILGVKGCSIYWFPDFASLHSAINMLSLDQRKVVIVADGTNERDFPLPMDVLIIRSGKNSGRINARHIFIGEDTYYAQNTERQLTTSNQQVLRHAASRIHEVGVSRYFDRLEQGRDGWSIVEARVVSDISLLRKPEHAEFMYDRFRTK